MERVVGQTAWTVRIEGPQRRGQSRNVGVRPASCGSDPGLVRQALGLLVMRELSDRLRAARADAGLEHAFVVRAGGNETPNRFEPTP